MSDFRSLCSGLGGDPAFLVSPQARCSALQRKYFFYIVYVMAGDYLGEFEHVVLLALLRLGEEAYGVSVRQEITHRTGRDVSVGAIYATLSRLEGKGFVRSRIGAATAERGGRAKRHFRVTARGIAIVERTHNALRRMAEGLTLKGSLA